MAGQVLPDPVPYDLTSAMRDAALRKIQAEEERKKQQQAMLLQLARKSIPAIATMAGGPAAGAVASAATPIAEQIFKSFGGD